MSGVGLICVGVVGVCVVGGGGGLGGGCVCVWGVGGVWVCLDVCVLWLLCVVDWLLFVFFGGLWFLFGVCGVVCFWFCVFLVCVLLFRHFFFFIMDFVFFLLRLLW